MHSAHEFVPYCLRSAMIKAQQQQLSETAGEHIQNIVKRISEDISAKIKLQQSAAEIVDAVARTDSLQQSGITLALKGLELACSAIQMMINTQRDQQHMFLQECNTNLASFAIDQKKKLRQCLPPTAQGIAKFYDLLCQAGPGLREYSGILIQTSPEYPDIQFLSVLPFFTMERELKQAVITRTKLDAYRQSASKLLETLPLSHYHTKFQKRITSFFRKINPVPIDIEKFRAPRLVLAATANILWTLQYPIDIVTGRPLTASEATERCKQAAIFFNQLLAKKQFPELNHIDSKHQYLRESLANIDSLIQGLAEQFNNENLHTIDLNSISQNLHSCIHLYSDAILKLLYPEPNIHATLSTLINLLNALVEQQPTLCQQVDNLSRTDLPADCINTPACSMVDILMLFCYQPPKKRMAFYKSQLKSSAEPSQRLGRLLQHLDEKFLKNLIPSDFPLLILIIASSSTFQDTRQTHNETTQPDSLQYKNLLQHFTLPSSNAMLHTLASGLFSLQQQSVVLDEYTHAVQVNQLLRQSKIFQNEIQQQLIALNKQLTTMDQSTIATMKISRDENAIIHALFTKFSPLRDQIKQTILNIQAIFNQPSFSRYEEDHAQRVNSLLQKTQRERFQDVANIQDSDGTASSGRSEVQLPETVREPSPPIQIERYYGMQLGIGLGIVAAACSLMIPSLQINLAFSLCSLVLLIISAYALTWYQSQPQNNDSLVHEDEAILSLQG